MNLRFALSAKEQPKGSDASARVRPEPFAQLARRLKTVFREVRMWAASSKRTTGKNDAPRIAGLNGTPNWPGLSRPRRPFCFDEKVLPEKRGWSRSH